MLGAVVVLVAVVGLALPILLDVDRYRDRVQALLRESTGWEAEIGELDLSVLRGMALTVRPARLADPGGASSVEVDTIAVKARLWPLLRGTLDVRSVELIAPRIDVVRPSLERGWVLPEVLATPQASASGEGPGTGGGLTVAVNEV